MSASLTAIPTTYRGIEYRSRLEARAAAAMLRKDWSIRYEPDAYTAGNTGYVPDFHVEHAGRAWPFWIEVKPTRAAVDADHKARQFALTAGEDVFYGYEGDSFLHQPESPWDPETWVAPLHLLWIDTKHRELRDTGRWLILPQYKDGEMRFPHE